MAAQANTSSLPPQAQWALQAYRMRLRGDLQHAGVAVAWAPGRANLIGEHTDYNEGYVLPVAIDRATALVGHATREPVARLYSVHHRQKASFSMASTALAAEPAPERLPLWARYVRGVLAELAQHGALPLLPGIVAAIAGNVPVGSGLSSSAALEVAVATFARALGGAELPAMRVAQLCQQAEQRSVGVRVGIMDQATSCLGRAGQAILLDCRSLVYTYVPVELPEVALAVYDTRVTRSLAASGYNERRAQCEQAVALLTQAIHAQQPERAITALRDITSDDLARYGDALPEVLLRRARHVVGENARVLAAVAALRLGDGASLGELL
ncbi:MAG: galactokinase family protein, partial [Ktedonobacterales bacterium]